jgi:hypothetical protein
LENTICHAMNATLGQIKLSKNLFLRQFFPKMQTNALLASRRFYDVKSGCYTSLTHALLISGESHDTHATQDMDHGAPHSQRKTITP